MEVDFDGHSRRRRFAHHPVSRLLGVEAVCVAMKYAFDLSFWAAAAAISLGTLTGVIVAQYPVEANPWVPPVAGGITAFAALIRRQFSVSE